MVMKITGVGSWRPPHKIENDFFDSLGIGSSKDWVVERTGIESRYSVLSEKTIREINEKKYSYLDLVRSGDVMTIATMCEEPWRIAKERSSLDGEGKIDFVICGTSVPDYDIPANACTISNRLNIKAPSVDVNSACSSFVADLHMARGLMATGSAEKIAVFNAERYSTRLDFNDRGSCILFGDGATAAVLENESSKPGFEVIDTIMESDPSGFDAVKIPTSGIFTQNGSAVQRFAITRTRESTLKILERNSLDVSDVSYFIGHQANLRMLTSTVKKIGIPEEKHLFNVHRCGNQGGAGAPSVLGDYWDIFNPGDTVILTVVGSGLTWGSALLRMT